MRISKSLITDLLILLIITVPSFVSLLNNQYFSMHDDQHIVRLFLFDQGLRQGQIYPRWVDGLGFGYGYPLFNFYPPMIYFISEIFHVMGFSLIWSIKLLIIFGYVFSAIGIYLFLKELTNRWAGYLGAVLYTYFFYHAVTAYVRGALAEFLSIAILPWLFYMMLRIAKKPTYERIVTCAFGVAILLLSHPLISFPSLFYIVICGLGFLYSARKHAIKYSVYLSIALVLGASLSSFFWLPSMIEKKYTMVDDILTTELANYKIHFIYPYQFLYSPWGYGGSGKGLNDGMTFQIGKIHIFMVITSIVFCAIYLILKKDKNRILPYYVIWLSLFMFSLFMTTEYSKIIWDNIKFLWYLQFPWRYLTFVGLFISVVGAYSILFLEAIVTRIKIKASWPLKYVIGIMVLGISLLTIGVYSKYFRPQVLRNVTDTRLTSDEEIKWRISRTSFEFVPKGVKTKKSLLNTTILAIEKDNIQKTLYETTHDTFIETVKNNFSYKSFKSKSINPFTFTLNTYNFPGWNAFIDNRKIEINDNNALKLINIDVPSGEHLITFSFSNTPVRYFANIVSLLSLLFCVMIAYIGKYKNKPITSLE